jgi:hypothetical protein
MDEITTAKLIEQARSLAQGQIICRYNGQVLEQIIREGHIPEGEVIARVGNQKLIREGDEVVSYKRDGRSWVPNKRTTITEEMLQKLLVQYAVTAAYDAANPIMMGSPNYK